MYQTSKVTLSQLAQTFLFIGLTSFGGGITAYVRRVIVDNKKWMSDEEFFPGLALSQLLPGANVLGISLYIGNHLCGLLGAAVAGLCIILPPSFIFFGLGYLYFSFGAIPSIEKILTGVGAVACGLMASMFVEAATAGLKHRFDAVVFISTFALVKWGHLHVSYAILIMAPIAIWWYRPLSTGHTMLLEPGLKDGTQLEKIKDPTAPGQNS